ncbi:hypothetical protein ACCO45_013864 [Purpureocillium lilacinum]|uniref:Uncharacterized protein n=1 Tax=Purpureocillium lilacinum TaxID=33203 RepID=A0ACC4D754_PURLI
MHPFSILTLGIFVAGYITARWDLVTRLYELAIFAAEYGVVIRVARGVVGLTALFLTIFLPVVFLARKETHLVSILGAGYVGLVPPLSRHSTPRARIRSLGARAASKTRLLLRPGRLHT